MTNSDDGDKTFRVVDAVDDPAVPNTEAQHPPQVALECSDPVRTGIGSQGVNAGPDATRKIRVEPSKIPLG